MTIVTRCGLLFLSIVALQGCRSSQRTHPSTAPTTPTTVAPARSTDEGSTIPADSEPAPRQPTNSAMVPAPNTPPNAAGKATSIPALHPATRPAVGAPTPPRANVPANQPTSRKAAEDVMP